MLLIFGVVFFVLSKIISSKPKVILLSLLLIWCFSIFIDYGNSVVRSCVMVTVYYIYILLQRKPDLLHAMALAGFILLIGNTQELFDLGFQLSFLAVFGIYWLNKPILGIFPKYRNRILRYFINITSISISAQIATLPLVLYYFHQFPLVSIVANLIVIPISEVFIIFSLLMTVCIGAGVSIQLLSPVYSFVADCFLGSVDFFANFDSLLVTQVSMSFGEVLLLFSMIYYLRFLLLRFGSKSFVQFCSVLLLFFATREVLDRLEERKNEVMVHTLYKEVAFSVQKSSHIYFWLPKDGAHLRFEEFLVQPYCIGRRIPKYSIQYYDRSSTEVLYEGILYRLSP